MIGKIQDDSGNVIFSIDPTAQPVDTALRQYKLLLAAGFIVPSTTDQPIAVTEISKLEAAGGRLFFEGGNSNENFAGVGILDPVTGVSQFVFDANSVTPGGPIDSKTIALGNAFTFGDQLGVTVRAGPSPGEEETFLSVVEPNQQGDGFTVETFNTGIGVDRPLINSTNTLLGFIDGVGPSGQVGSGQFSGIVSLEGDPNKYFAVQEIQEILDGTAGPAQGVQIFSTGDSENPVVIGPWALDDWTATLGGPSGVFAQSTLESPSGTQSGYAYYRDFDPGTQARLWKFEVGIPHGSSPLPQSFGPPALAADEPLAAFVDFTSPDSSSPFGVWVVNLETGERTLVIDGAQLVAGTGGLCPSPINVDVDSGIFAAKCREYQENGATISEGTILVGTFGQRAGECDLEVTPASLDFGEVNLFSNLPVFLSNVGSRECNVSLGIGTIDFGVDMTSLTVPPGATRNVFVELKAFLPGDYTDELTITSDPPQRRVVVPVRATLLGGEVPVPNVTGEFQAVAEVTIVEAGLTVGTVMAKPDETVEAGKVISQEPAPGVSAEPGSAVNLVMGGMHLTPKAQTYSMWAHGGLPADAGGV